MIDFILHIDKYLVDLVGNYQGWTYLILFLIVFAETGFVVTPFLPGDSLLFAAGALSAKPDAHLNPYSLIILLFLASVSGDFVNYHLGKWIGHKAFSGKYTLLKQSYLAEARDFYARYGGKTIIYARFLPLLRTFAPFVAGIGTMPYQRFMSYNLLGAIIWVSSFIGLGYFFGQLPLVKQNFTYVVLGIIVLSVLPVLIQALRLKFGTKKG